MMNVANDLKPRDKAQAGLWLIRQAILQLLEEKQEEMRPSQIRDALGLSSSENLAPGIAAGVMNFMVDIEELKKGEGHHPPYSVKKKE